MMVMVDASAVVATLIDDGMPAILRTASGRLSSPRSRTNSASTRAKMNVPPSASTPRLSSARLNGSA